MAGTVRGGGPVAAAQGTKKGKTRSNLGFLGRRGGGREEASRPAYAISSCVWSLDRTFKGPDVCPGWTHRNDLGRHLCTCLGSLLQQRGCATTHRQYGYSRIVPPAHQSARPARLPRQRARPTLRHAARYLRTLDRPAREHVACVRGDHSALISDSSWSFVSNHQTQPPCICPSPPPSRPSRPSTVTVPSFFRCRATPL